MSKFDTFTYIDITFPFDHIGDCYLRAQKAAKVGPENWDATDSKLFREFLGNDYAKYDEHKLRLAAVSFRKKQLEEGGLKDYKIAHGIPLRKSGNGRGENGIEITPELARHYKSDDYTRKRDEIFRRHPICQVCGWRPSEECHHCTHDNIGKPEEINDLIAVCKIDHVICNDAKRAAAREKKRLEKERRKGEKELERQLLAEINGICPPS